MTLNPGENMLKPIAITLALTLTAPAWAGRGNGQTPPGLAQNCEAYEQEEPAPTSVEELGDALAQTVITRLEALEVPADAPVTTLATPSRVLAVATRTDSNDRAEYVTRTDSSAPLLFAGEPVRTVAGGAVGITVYGSDDGVLTTTVRSYDEAGAMVAEREIKQRLPFDGLQFRGSTPRLEGNVDGTTVTATAKYGDILIDGVPLEFD